MRRLDGGAGRRRGRRQALNPAAGARQFRASCWCGARGRGSHSPHPGGVGAPPGGTTVPCQELADDRRECAAKARPDAGRRTPQQSAERRAGPRHWPVISGDPEIGPPARRATGCGASAPAPVGALLPLVFRGAENGQGVPAPPKRADGAWLFDNRVGTRCSAGELCRAFQMFDAGLRPQYRRNNRNIAKKHHCAIPYGFEGDAP